MNREEREFKTWLFETRDQPLETMEGFFDARISEYEAHMAEWSRHYQWMAQLLSPSTEELLDIGCGTGLELDCIFARFPSMRVTGIDLSERMLAKLQEKHGEKALTLIRDDYFRYPLGQDCYDAVVAFETLHHVTAVQKTKLFQRVYQCLKPGGIYLECDYIATSLAIEEMAFAECARRRRRDGIPADAFVHFDTPLTLEHELQALRDGGFSMVEVVGFLPGDNHTPMLRAIK